MQVQDDARARGARGGEAAPAEHRVDIVGVDDVGARAADGRGDVVRVDPAAQHRHGRPTAAEDGRVAFEHLDLLAQPLAREPRRSSTARSSPPDVR